MGGETFTTILNTTLTQLQPSIFHSISLKHIASDLIVFCMAKHQRIPVMTLCVILLLLELHFFVSIAASRDPKSHSNMPKPPTIGGFTLNRYKMIEKDAFRPTSPGHSPGIGHDVPPSVR